jgi:hypothetical protein
MGPRSWAAIGNVLKISAAFGFLSCLYLADRAFNRAVPEEWVNSLWIAVIGGFVLSIVLWNLKGPLVRGNLWVRVPIGLYMIFWVVGTLGLGLIWILIVYMFTGEPSTYDRTPRGKAPKPRFKEPANWQPTAKVGPSGAMVYADPYREAASGILDSYTPVQVVDKQGSAARVVAASGESGWIDLRTLTEPA